MAVVVQATFDDELKKIFGDWVKSNIPSKFLYYSPEPRGKHIQGDITHDLHLTLYFGLPKTALHNEDLPKVIEEHIINSITLGDFELIDGYQSLYKIFTINVLDEDNRLKSLCEKISYFAWEDKYSKRFKPHLTLAYVTNEFVIPESENNLPKLVNIKNIEITEK